MTNTTLTISSLVTNNATNNQVVVTKAYGSVTSAAATLTVIVPPSITTQHASTTNYATQTTTFAVTASGTSPLSYQWQVETNGSYVNLSSGGQFSGVTSATLTISSLVANNTTNYEVVVTNAAGSVTSATATLTVLNAIPSITTQPANTTNTTGQTATFSVVAAGLAPLSYQWKVESGGSYVNLSNAGQFSGVTNTTLSISSLALTNATNYEVVVTNSSGSVTSSAAALTVNSSANYKSVILGDAPVSYWPMQETTGPTINDIVTTNAGPFNGTVQISTDGFTNGGTDGEGKVWGIIHETFTNSTSAAATDGATYLFGGSGGLASLSGDTAIYFTNLNGQLNNAQIAMGTGGTGAYEAQLDASVFSVEAWINVPTYPIGWTSNTFQAPLSLNAIGNSGNTDNGWFMGVKTDSSGSGAYGEMFFEAGTGTAYTTNGPSAQVFSGKWVYAVQEYNGTATVIYTNGTLMVSNTQTYQPLSHSSSHELPFIIGSQNAYYFSGSASSGNTRADFWDGGISHVAYYNYALSASKITNHYYYGTNAGYKGVILTDHPASYWPLNETTGTTIHDVAGTNNGTAVNTNGLTLSWPGILSSQGDTAIYFNNTNNGYVSVPYSSTLNTTNFSVEAWLDMPTFPANAQSANENPVSFCNGGTPHGWTFDIQVANAANPSLYAWVAKNSSGWNSVNSGVAIQGKWSYYAMTFNGTTLTVYTNGVSATSASVTNYTMASSGQYLLMGDYNDTTNSADTNRYYQGAMEKVAIYTNALSSSRILAHYQAGTNSP